MVSELFPADHEPVLNESQALNTGSDPQARPPAQGFFLLIVLLLSPVLLLQGLFTRKSVPILPEPAGAREGSTGEGPQLKLLIVGDSAAAGVGVVHQDQALLGQVVSRLSSDFRVSWCLGATTGNTTVSALKWLETQAPQRFDVAVTSLGVNDVTRFVGRDRWREQQAQLRSVLREKFQVEKVLISGLPPMHGFPALPQPLRWVLGARATQMNDDLQRDVAAEGTALFLNLRFTADTTLMASDGFHPGPRIYAEWGRRVVALLQEG